MNLSLTTRLNRLFCNKKCLIALAVIISGIALTEKLKSQTYRSSTPVKSAYPIQNQNRQNISAVKGSNQTAKFLKTIPGKLGFKRKQSGTDSSTDAGKKIKTVQRPFVGKEKLKKFFHIKKKKQNVEENNPQARNDKPKCLQQSSVIPHPSAISQRSNKKHHKQPKLSIEFDQNDTAIEMQNRSGHPFQSITTHPTSKNTNNHFLEKAPSRTIQTQFVLPAPGNESLPSVSENSQLIELPIAATPSINDLKVTSHQGNVSLMVRDAPISAVLGLIAQQNGLNIVASSGVTGTVTVSLTNVNLNDALSSILITNGYTWSRKNNIIQISPMGSDLKESSIVQGKQVKVYTLNFVAASDVDIVVKGLLSPVGQSFISETKPLEKLKTREQIVVEDLPEYVARIGQYIHQIDVPPRQVYIEAHILQVNLKDENKHGINFNALMRYAGADITLRTTGFANPLASPAFFLGINGTDLDALVEALQTNFNATTLASPKVLVLNGQEARIQIGQQLGYLITTTTQTSTLQQVDFLDLGVVLHVTPQISEDGQILMTVKPEVSSGRINPNSGLPEEETTEVETTIMLSDNQGMIIGGLIKEDEVNEVAQVPILGDIWLAGKLFQKRRLTRERNEIIIALVPRIVPYGTVKIPEDEIKLNQVQTKMFKDPLYQPKEYKPFFGH